MFYMALNKKIFNSEDVKCKTVSGGYEFNYSGDARKYTQEEQKWWEKYIKIDDWPSQQQDQPKSTNRFIKVDSSKVAKFLKSLKAEGIERINGVSIDNFDLSTATAKY